MKVALLVAVPPGVVTLIFPVFAPLGTVAVIFVYEFTLKLVALTPPKVTLVAPVKLWPLITTLVPGGPLVGEKLEICGVTRKFTLLVNVWLGVVTLTLPVVTPLGTVVLISELETTVRSRGAVESDFGGARQTINLALLRSKPNLEF